MLIGVPLSGRGPTSPLILNTEIPLCTLEALEFIVTLLLIGPGRLVSYLTRIDPVAPGAIGSFGHSGTVHPQDPLALDIIKFSVPVFLNSKLQ